MNGSLIQTSYCAFNNAFTFYGQDNYVFGILFLLFLTLLFIQNRNIEYNFIVTLLLFFLCFVWIPTLIRGVVIIILLFELIGSIWDLFFSEGN
jgi:hypothetical protein